MAKDVVFIGSSLKDLKKFPDDARAEAGYAIHLAQIGSKAINAVPMTGFGNAGVLEVVIPDDGDAYRAVYTVKFDTAIYVLHAFQKKSRNGVKTPYQDVELIRKRLKDAESLHKAAAAKETKSGKASR